MLDESDGVDYKFNIKRIFYGPLAASKDVYSNLYVEIR